MDVLIIGRDDLIGSTLTDTLDGEGISAAVASDEEALKLPQDDAPQIVITSINRGHNEDMRGLRLVSVMRHKWPQLCAIYLAALRPVHLRPEMLAEGERFLPKPVRLTQMIRVVRDLLDSGICHRPA